MKTRFLRKLIALMMAFAMLITSVPVLATSPHHEFEPYARHEGDAYVICFVVDGVIITLRTIEMDNGDIIFYEYADGLLLRRGGLYYNQNDRMYITNYVMTETGDARILETTETVIYFNDFIADGISSVNFIAGYDVSLIQPLAFQRPMGSIMFSHPAYGSYGIHVMYSVFVLGNTTFTIRNLTTTTMGLAAMLLHALSIPTVFASRTAAWVLWSIGTLLLCGSFFVDHTILSAERAHVTFSARNLIDSSHTTSRTIVRHTINDIMHPQLYGLIYWQGYAESYSLWGVWTFASTLHILMWPARSRHFFVDRWIRSYG